MSGPSAVKLTPKNAITWLLFGIASAALLLGTWFTRIYLMDDALITLRYSLNFARFGIPIWNQADLSNPSMGYTSLLWMALNALPALFTQNKDLLVLFAQGFALAALLVTAWLLCREIAHLTVTTAAKIIITLLVFAQMGYGLHVNSGMETLLFSLLVVAVFLAYRKDRPGLAHLFAGLAFLTRPEGALICGLLVLAELLRRRYKSALLATAGYVVMLAGVYFLLMGWYGDFLPNTFYAKQELLNTAAVKRTVFFLITLALPSLVLTLYSAFHLKQRPALYVLIVSTVYLAYYLSVDPIMNVMSRYQWPFLILMTFASLPAIEYLLSNPRKNKVLVIILLLVTAGLDLGNAFGALYFANATGHAQRNIVRIGKHLAQFRQEDQWLIYHDAGAVCYFSDWNTVETTGLTNGALARKQVKRADLFSNSSATLAMQNFDLSSKNGNKRLEEYTEFMSTYDFKFIENIPVLFVEGQRNFIVAVYSRDETYAHQVLDELEIDRSFKQDFTYRLYRLAKDLFGD